MSNRSLPHPLPNEHLLSVLARWFDLSGRNDFHNTARQLSTNVGNLSPAAAWRPIYWDLANHYRNAINWDQLIRVHTLMPYYSPFVEPSLRTALLNGNEELATTKIQAPQQKHMVNAHLWRWCVQCAESDFEEYGTTYWHTFHQLPSALTCYRHNTPLVSMCPTCGFTYDNFQRHWLPPIDGECRECQTPITVSNHPRPTISHRLDRVSVGLQIHGMNIEQASLLQPIRHSIGFESLPSNLTVAIRSRIATLQQQFQTWLPDEVIPTYFSLNRDHAFQQSNPILKLVSVAYRKRSALPLCVLLMLMFLDLEEEFLGDLSLQAFKVRLA